MRKKRIQKKQLGSILGWLIVMSLLLVTLVGELGQWWWFFDLFAHFKLQYFLIAGLFALIALLFQLRKFAFVFLFIALINFCYLFPYLRPLFYHSEFNQSSELKVLYANIYYQSVDVERVSAYVERYQPDLIVFVEVQDDDYLHLQQELTSWSDTLHVDGKSPHPVHDISYFARPGLVQKKQILWFEEKTPSLALEIVPSEGVSPIQILAVHPLAPYGKEMSDDRDLFLKQAALYLADADKTLFVGDSNVTQFSPILRQFVKTTQLQDVRLQYGLQPSWPTNVPSILRIPIDQVLVSKDLQVSHFKVGDDIGSDHLPLEIELHFSQTTSKLP